MSDKKRILIVDDDHPVCAQLGAIVEYLGYEPVLAVSAEEALAHVKEKPVDLALADIHMPGMDGLALLHELHALHKALPVIMLTGFPSEESIRRTLLEGGYTYLAKPVDLNQLKNLLQHALESKSKK